MHFIIYLMCEMCLVIPNVNLVVSIKYRVIT
jgi:hypothetical protein